MTMNCDCGTEIFGGCAILGCFYNGENFIAIGSPPLQMVLLCQTHIEKYATNHPTEELAHDLAVNIGTKLR